MDAEATKQCLNRQVTKPNSKRRYLVMSYIGQFRFFAVIDPRDGGFALGNNHVIHNIVGEHAIF